jgi:hypothetical protein
MKSSASSAPAGWGIYRATDTKLGRDVAIKTLSNWLSGFVYRTDIPWSSFVLATAGTATLALVTVGREISRAMRSRPVNSLRYE